MWPKFYKDYPVDSQLIKNRIEPGRGIAGCEMHELNGWGNSCHITPQEWRSISEAKRKPHMGYGDSISSLPKL